MRSVIPVLILYMMFSGIFTSHAHANLEHSIPRGNAHVITAPDEIRLFFTEALEPQFSQIQVRNSSGQVMALPLSQVDVSDTHQLYIVSSSLPDDVYTISWKVMSQTDGHVTQGSFPITIGSVSVSDSYPTVAEPSADGIPVFSSFVRWINFISLALWMGSLGMRGE